MNDVAMFRKLREEPAEYWRKLLTSYLTSDNYVLVIGEPDKTYMEEFSGREKARLAKQIEKLGNDGLKLCADTLDNAIEENEVLILLYFIKRH